MKCQKLTDIYFKLLNIGLLDIDAQGDLELTIINNSTTIKKYIVIQYIKFYYYNGFIKRKNLKENLEKYYYYILDDYFHPSSNYMKYFSENMDDMDDSPRQIAYLNDKKELKFFKIKK